MASFDDREKGYENKYAHDQELEFKARARRDRLLAAWVSPQLGLTGAAAEAYGQALTDYERSRFRLMIALGLTPEEVISAIATEPARPAPAPK